MIIIIKLLSQVPPNQIFRGSKLSQVCRKIMKSPNFVLFCEICYFKVDSLFEIYQNDASCCYQLFYMLMFKALVC